MEPVQTTDDIEFEIFRAYRVLRALPKEGPRGLRSSWPDLIMEEDKTKYTGFCVTSFKPLPQEIDDMNEVFENWMKVLTYEERLIVLKRAAGLRWKEILYVLPIARSTLFFKYKTSLKKILKHVLLEQAKTQKQRGCQ